MSKSLVPPLSTVMNRVIYAQLTVPDVALRFE